MGLGACWKPPEALCQSPKMGAYPVQTQGGSLRVHSYNRQYLMTKKQTSFSMARWWSLPLCIVCRHAGCLHIYEGLRGLHFIALKHNIDWGVLLGSAIVLLLH